MAQQKLFWTVVVLIKIDICSDLHVDRHFEQTRLLVKPGEGPTHWPADQYGDREAFFHFDFEWHRNAGSSTLIIAGDVSDHLSDVYDVLSHACKFYDNVVFVDGNHEHHGNKDAEVSDNCDEITDFKISLPNLIYLDGQSNASAVVGRTAFIGGNGWYDWRCHEKKGISFPKAFASWDDNSQDRHLNFGDYEFPSTLGYEQVESIVSEVRKATLDQNIDTIVMVTHSAPLAECLIWYDDRPSWNLGSPSYVNTELAQVFEADTNKKIRLWAYGHTHTRRTWQYNGIMMVNNCYGYPKENTGGWSMSNFEVI